MQMSYLYSSDLPFKNFCKLAQHAETTRKNVWERSNDAYTLSIRLQTTINHISIFMFLFFYHNINVKAWIIEETGLETYWRDRLNPVEFYDVTKNVFFPVGDSVGHNSSLWSQCKTNCPQVLGFVFTKADASIGIKDFCLLPTGMRSKS